MQHSTTSKSISQLEELEIIEGELSNHQDRINELLIQTGLKNKTKEELMREKKKRKEIIEDAKGKISQIKQAKWMVKRGKSHLIEFDQQVHNFLIKFIYFQELQQLKNYYSQLNTQNKQGIGIEELEDPLISLGLAHSRQDVKKIIDSVDDDGSNCIEFSEFLDIIKNNDSSGDQSLIVTFFKSLIENKIEGISQMEQQALQFQNIISIVRRKKFWDYWRCTGEKKKEGEKVLIAYEKLQNQVKRRKRAKTKSKKKNPVNKEK